MFEWLVSPIGRLLGIATLAVALITGIYTKGHMDGSASMKAKWDAAIAASLKKETEAREKAIKEIEAHPDGVKNDPNNRDNQ